MAREPGRAAFKVYLPCSARDVSLQAAASIAPVAVAPVGRDRGSLLVETGRRASSLEAHLESRLSSAGSRERGRGREGVCAQADAIDLVVTDVIMHGCGGPELLTRLQVRVPALKALYMSGYTEQSAAQKAGINRGLPFVQKPFTAAEFVRHVREALDQ